MPKQIKRSPSPSVPRADSNEVGGSVKDSDKKGNDVLIMFELAGFRCKLIELKDSKPKPIAIEVVLGQRCYRYVPHEIVHFCLDGHWYALCKDEVVTMRPNDSKVGKTTEHKLSPRLTERESQIVQMVCHGLLTKQIADRLCISEFTVNTYIKAVFNKLGVRSRAAMVYKCTGTGPVPSNGHAPIEE